MTTLSGATQSSIPVNLAWGVSAGVVPEPSGSSGQAPGWLDPHSGLSSPMSAFEELEPPVRLEFEGQTLTQDLFVGLVDGGATASQRALSPTSSRSSVHSVYFTPNPSPQPPALAVEHAEDGAVVGGVGGRDDREEVDEEEIIFASAEMENVKRLDCSVLSLGLG